MLELYLTEGAHGQEHRSVVGRNRQLRGQGLADQRWARVRRPRFLGSFAGRLLRRWRRHIIFQAARDFGWRLRLGTAAKRPDALRISMPELPAERPNLWIRI